MNDAVGASERLTVSWKSRPVNKATRPAELCQWLRGGGCDSKPQVNHAHIHTHTCTHAGLCSLSSSVSSLFHTRFLPGSRSNVRVHTPNDVALNNFHANLNDSSSHSLNIQTGAIITSNKQTSKTDVGKWFGSETKIHF